MDKKISAVLVIKNEAPQLMEYFEHVRRFCDEIIVVVQDSDDTSLLLCLNNCDKVFISKNNGYCECDWGFASSNAKNDWVCILCPDERFENKFITDLDKLLKTCKDNKQDSIQCRVEELYDGISLNGQRKTLQCRMFKKGLTFEDRVHTCVSFKNSLNTPYIQYHFKNYVKTLENEKERTNYYTERQKLVLGQFFYNLKTFIIKHNKLNKQFLSDIYKGLKNSDKKYTLLKNDTNDLKLNVCFNRPK